MFNQQEFNEFVLKNGVIGFHKQPVQFTSGRYSNWYVNWRDVTEDAFLLDRLSDYIIEFVRGLEVQPDCFHGVPEGATKIGVITQFKWAKQSPSFSAGSHVLSMSRGKMKEHGEPKDRHFLGESKGKTFVVEDVTTTGTSLISTLDKLRDAGVEVAGAIGLTNRMEKRDDGMTVKEAIESRGIPYYYMSNSFDLLPEAYSKEKPGKDIGRAIEIEFENYGIQNITLVSDNGEIIDRDKSIIIACDLPLNVYEEVIRESCDYDAIGGYKVGFELALEHGLGKVVEITRKYTNKPIIYDHQKAGTDAPFTGESFAKVCFEAGVDGVIFFPMAGPETQNAWIDAAKEKKLGVIVGGRMTHGSYVRSEGGYIADDAVGAMYLAAARKGVNHFVVPGNNLEMIKKIRDGLEASGVQPVFYAPGFVEQGGSISEAARVAGDRWHAIVGRGIYWNKEENRYNNSGEIREKVGVLVSQLN
tara:strand:+ start:1331 stop:2746 length:1416 start_codon:yes stop_codon:yes gene_type:complete